jgi:hypothetical protein
MGLIKKQAGFDLESKIRGWCEDNNIKKYSLTKDYMLDTVSSVYLINELEPIKYKLRECESLWLNRCEVKDLSTFPDKVYNLSITNSNININEILTRSTIYKIMISSQDNLVLKFGKDGIRLPLVLYLEHCDNVTIYIHSTGDDYEPFISINHCTNINIYVVNYYGDLHLANNTFNNIIIQNSKFRTLRFANNNERFNIKYLQDHGNTWNTLKNS